MTMTPIRVIDHPQYGEQRLYRFPNTFGASVIRSQYSHGGTAGLYELAVIRYRGEGVEDFDLDYSTPITSDTIGWLTEEDVQLNLQAVAALVRP